MNSVQRLAWTVDGNSAHSSGVIVRGKEFSSLEEAKQRIGQGGL